MNMKPSKSIVQAKAIAAEAWENYQELLRLQERLVDDIPAALAEYHAKQDNVCRLAAETASASQRAEELSYLEQRLDGLKAGDRQPVTTGAADTAPQTLDQLINEVTGE